ncbi:MULTISPECIES: hypothetical protein [unclassified Pseudonocardia]|uniref:hypothetical protein n=1 Tax=unclassified Pseudonocardia TaxID=2619320 RepID=UPI000301370B|nr:hypothetical protein [Pseudonocardia sp. Ae707_Ps1]OLM09194.1 hypothetical protein Ae707Ps1_6141c [Pseudonocardia sp. Ae707_Ps1]
MKRKVGYTWLLREIWPPAASSPPPRMSEHVLHPPLPQPRPSPAPSDAYAASDSNLQK